MTLEQLRIFVAVAERRHMTRAAEALGVTQSAASAAVSALEARYGVRLFNRVGRGLELSEAGAMFLGEARAVLACATHAAGVLGDLAGLKRGAVRVAASQTVANYWLPARMAAFAAAFPAIDLSLAVANTAQVAAMLASGDADLGFVEGPVDDPRLETTDVGGDRICLYAAPGHRLVVAGEVAPGDLSAASWVMREAEYGTRAELETALAARGVDPASLRVLLELPSNEAVLGAAAAGGAVAAVSDLAAAPHVAAGRLRRAKADLIARRFTLLTHRERAPSRAVSAFMEQLHRP